ncbi:Flp pilus assembly protein TadG [Microbacterium endophyticum]|uniref:Flp pilus assembly protein TadG n=1 Tax=Microbacterium endophyticum TaxID=1526412 RepID=A0A7W4V0Q6_9MICO|nr:TadE family protein [Microbacterium endophyticum]MBB2974728.1 Flp pilus assembly protein TadG [Microbacterium endophyticum]NIK37025.1 Flp pilus assembly protein TadG [Microbacterium endophyticum]
MSSPKGLFADDRGSAPVEFVLVGLMLTALTLAVLQFGLAVYVRNVVHDAAVDGAYHAALADTTTAEGAQRTRDIVSRTIGAGYAADVSVREEISTGNPTVVVSVRTTMPIIGLFGIAGTWEVSGRAPIENFG